MNPDQNIQPEQSSQVSSPIQNQAPIMSPVKKSNTGIIIAVVGVLLLLVGGVYEYYTIYVNPVPVLPTQTASSTAQTINQQNNQTNMPTDLKSQFIAFFKEFRTEAGKKNFDFVKKTIPQAQLESLMRMQKMSEEEIVASQAKDAAEITDEMITAYTCENNVCSATIMWYNDPQNTTKWNYVFSDGVWLSKEDGLPSVEQLNTADSLSNDYQISFYSQGKATFKIFLNGSEIYSVDNPTGNSTNKPLMVNKGGNKIEIEIIPSGQQKVAYSYDIYQFPKGAGQGAIFNDKYKLLTTTKSGEIAGFVNLDLNKTEKIELPFTAK